MDVIDSNIKIRRKVMRKGFFLLLVVAVLFPAGGCNLLGPSEEDVKGAYEAVLRGLDSSTKNNDKPEVHSEYVNAADVPFKVPDNTTLHNMSVFINTEDGSAHISGDCSFTDYVDTTSGYKINGTFAYEVNAFKNKGPEDMYGQMNCDVTLSGGKLNSFALHINKNKEGTMEKSMKANGKEIDLDKWQKAFDAIRTINPLLPRM
jgi:hypothetical protein